MGYSAVTRHFHPHRMQRADSEPGLGGKSQSRKAGLGGLAHSKVELVRADPPGKLLQEGKTLCGGLEPFYWCDLKMD